MVGTGSGAWRRRYAVSGAGWSGGLLAGGDGDVEAEGFQLADVAADLAAGVGVLRVVIRAEVAVAGLGVLEQVPDDDEDGAPDGDDCSFLIRKWW